MNSGAVKMVWVMGGVFVVITLLMYLMFSLLDIKYYPEHLWIIPAFFFIIAFLFGLFVSRNEKGKKELSVGTILLVRVAFIGVITAALLIHAYVDRSHALSVAVAYAVFALTFSVFETKILLILNKQNIE